VCLSAYASIHKHIISYHIISYHIIMASAASLLPQQQQQGEAEANPEAVSRSASSGSIGPFFAVISVLAVLAIISCVLGRICSRRRAVESPLESIKYRGCWGWFRRRCRRCMAGEVEAGARVMACGEVKTNDVNKAQEQAQPQP
ncbi:Alpha-protein kinase 1-like, partial [Melia azedarach]